MYNCYFANHFHVDFLFYRFVPVSNMFAFPSLSVLCHPNHKYMSAIFLFLFRIIDLASQPASQSVSQSISHSISLCVIQCVCY